MFKVSRTLGRNVDFLADWDSEWIASFKSNPDLAMDFKRRKVATNAVDYLNYRLPSPNDDRNLVFKYEVV